MSMGSDKHLNQVRHELVDPFKNIKIYIQIVFIGSSSRLEADGLYVRLFFHLGKKSRCSRIQRHSGILIRVAAVYSLKLSSGSHVFLVFIESSRR